MKTIRMLDEAGEFCENKDVAKKLREEEIIPALDSGGSITLDFSGVTGATQSFIHALVSDVIRKFQDYAFDNLFYKNASPEVQKIISIVYNNMQMN